jgi:hypothetical protein
VCPGDPDVRDSGADGETEWVLQHQRLAVDAGSDRAVGADLELRRRPLAPRPLRLAAFAASARRSAAQRRP